jgi:transcriptional regulator of met regulon
MTSRRRQQDRRRAQRRAPGAEGRIIPSRAHGEKHAYVKVTVTLPPELYELIINETTKRKLGKAPNPQVSAVVREALVRYFEALVVS